MKDDQFLRIASIVAESSKCVSLKVGALIVKDGRIISTGYNGTPPKYPNCCDMHSARGPEHSEWSRKHETHAEVNAISFAARFGVAVEGATMYCTIEPCWECLKTILPSGIRRIVFTGVYYRESIDTHLKAEFADSCGVSLEHYSSGSITPSTLQPQQFGSDRAEEK